MFMYFDTDMLRKKYEMIYKVESEKAEHPEKAEQVIRQLKDEIRSYNRNFDYYYRPEESWRHFRGDYEYGRRYALTKVCDHFTEEEKAEYIENSWVEWYNPWDDGRDCTGMWFTTALKLFSVPDGTWIYEAQACDV